MPVTTPDEDRTSGVTFRADVFDALCEVKGATTEVARAALIGVERRTIHRWRKFGDRPTLDNARRTALVLGCKPEDLWP